MPTGKNTFLGTRGEYTNKWIERYNWAYRLKSDLNNVFLEYYKSYMGILDLENWPYDSTLFIPSVFSTIETVKPRLMQSIFGSWPYIAVQPSKVLNRADYTTAKEEAIAVQARLNQQMDYPAFFITASDWITQACWWGHSPLKVYWKYDAVNRPFYTPKMNRETGVMEYEKKDMPVVLWDDICHELVNQRNLFYPNEGKTLDDKDWIIEQVDRSYEYIERMIDLEYYDAKRGSELLEIMKGGEGYSAYTQEAQERLNVKGIKFMPGRPYASKTLLLECWDKWTNERSVIDYATGIELTPTRININGEAPYVGITPVSVPHETEGLGLIGPIYDGQGQINILTNIGMDSLMLNLAPPLMIDRRSDFEADYMTAQPGKVYRVYDVNTGMKYLQPNNLPVDHWKQIQFLQMQNQDTSGINDSAKGLENAGTQGGPAATYIAKQEAANMRIRLMKEIICNTGLAQLAEKSLRLNRINDKQDRFIPGANRYTKGKNEVIETKPEMYMRNYRFRSGSGSRSDLSPSLLKAQWLELLAITSKLQPGQVEAEGMRVKLTGIIKQIAETSEIPWEELLETVATPGAQNMAGEMQNLLTGPEGGNQGASMPQNLGTNGNDMIQRLAQAGVK